MLFKRKILLYYNNLCFFFSIRLREIQHYDNILFKSVFFSLYIIIMYKNAMTVIV